MNIENLPNVSTIKHASINPGVGKTFWAINVLTKRIVEKDGITLFVAPTKELLKEVELKILANLNSNLHKRLHLVTGVKGEVSTKNKIRRLVSGTQSNTGAGTFAAQPVGTVILCTHAAFALLPHYYKDGLDVPAFKDREKVSIIYDEARKCVVNENKITLPFNIAQKLLISYFKTEASKFANTNYRPVTVVSRDDEALDSLFGKTSSTRMVREVIKNVFKSTSSCATKLYLQTNIKEDSLDSTKTNMVLQTIRVPHLLFSGWKEVILLSAFFETSQMYHLLRTRELELNALARRDGEFKKHHLVRLADIKISEGLVRLVDITAEVADVKRIDLVNKRYMQSSITYISPNVSLSKKHLTTGILMDSLVKKTWDSKAYSNEYKNIAKQKVKVEGGLLTSLRGVLNTITDIKTEKRNYTPSNYDLLLVDYLKTLPGVVLNYTPLEWYSKAAVHMSKKWYAHLNLPNQPLPITCNKGNGEFAVQVKNVLKIGDYELMPVNSQGLNFYKERDTIAFLTTLNPTPEAKKFLANICPTYDTELDFTLDQCVQSLTRCSVRSTDSKSKPLFIVTDKILAEKVIKHLGGFPKLIDPSFFGIPLKDPFTLDFDEGAKLRKELHRKTVGAKLRASALHKYLFMYSKFYGKMKNSKNAVYKFKKTGSSKLESELIKLADLEIKYKKEHTQLLKDFNIEYAEKINIS